MTDHAWDIIAGVAACYFPTLFAYRATCAFFDLPPAFSVVVKVQTILVDVRRSEAEGDA